MVAVVALYEPQWPLSSGPATTAVTTMEIPMLTTEQRQRALVGIYAAIAAIKDPTPMTDEERRQHDVLVRRELERRERQQSLELK